MRHSLLGLFVILFMKANAFNGMDIYYSGGTILRCNNFTVGVPYEETATACNVLLHGERDALLDLGEGDDDLGEALDSEAGF